MPGQLRTAGIPHIREVQFLGTGIFALTSDYLDLIALRGHEQAVAMAMAACLDTRNDWDRLWLTSVPSSSGVFPWFLEALGKGLQTAVVDCSHVVDTSGTWETLLDTLGRSTRRGVIKGMRRRSRLRADGQLPK